MKALCCILNYNYNENANYLYNEFNKYCEAHVIDSNSDNPYPYFENVGNFYYTNLFNISIKKIKEGNYSNLIYITSDVEVKSNVIEYMCNIANNDMRDIGVYNLQSDKKSKDWHNHWNLMNTHKIIDNKYYVNMCEGFCNILHHDVAILHKKIPLDVNKIGVCITEYTCEISRILNKKIMVDCKYTIYHPNLKGYNNDEAHSYDKKFKRWYEQELQRIRRIL